jgi:mandelate racemase
MTSITITGIKVRQAMVPLRRPLATSFGVFTHGPFLFVDLECVGGLVGRVSGFAFHALGMRLVPEVLTELGQLFKGRQIELADVPAFHDEAQKKLMLVGHEGITQLGLSMFDMAMHDALGRAHGQPLYRLLGAKSVSIQAYNSCGMGIAEPAELVAEARALAAEHGGFSHIKMRLGRTDIGADLAAIRAVREALGPSVQVSVDFNQALPAAVALEACRRIDNVGLTWIEEPIAYDDYESQARLTAKLATPVQTGETWWHWRVAQRAMQMRASDYCMPDILRIGGVTGWIRTARAAQAASMPMSSHLSPEYSAHVLAASPTHHWLEYMDWAQDFLLDPLIPHAGLVRPRETPGAGIDWNEAALAKVLS